MSYRWITPDKMELRPHRSLPKQGFAVVILLFFTLVSVPMAAMVGTMVLWGLLPFAMIALAALWWALQRSYRDGEILETLEIGETEARLTRQTPDGKTQDWACNPYWVRVQKYATEGPVPHYVTLNGNGREVEIGAFLAEEERIELYGDLADRFARLRKA
ncbi:DUF2244 domain-containing protein [Pseudooceanicola sp. C21-150M6]|uniref:DUF2244 domain-containing protein n=1 Tax=Pseudooceanicola sp. C21-150M6 TaxID=3434355 RepID=UPI003D7FF124